MITSARSIKIYPGIPIDVAYGCVKEYLLADRGDKAGVDSIGEYTVVDYGRSWRISVYQTKTMIVVRESEQTNSDARQSV
jgi:hypothetical protein